MGTNDGHGAAMIGINPKELDLLFRRYGFTPEVPHEQVRVYLRSAGYFQNAEIVPLSTDAPVEDVQKDFQASGYACKVSRFGSVADAERQLFHGFFQQEATSQRLRREYAEFCAKKTRALGSPYQYVTAPYLFDGKPHTGPATITEAIQRCLNEAGPVLVFLEAAAGFGKTCTAFELLRCFIEGSTIRNPILAELQRNRQARIFRYVLLDEMDRNYQACGLTSEMVEREIKSGRIPLIIDGFDELLHLDRDGGADGQFAEIEPMLRTLSGILESEAKVLVTTRRTAILGDQFEDWLTSLVNENKAAAYRFTLQEPEIDDWVGSERRHSLEECGFPLRSLANPVLLAFLRTASADEFDRLCSEPTGLVGKYFDSLLHRERERQELPLSPERQIQILTTLATRMLTTDSSSLPRDDLKQLVLHEHHDMLREALRSAPGIAATTPEELADKLTDHALLDRKPGRVAGIGFVNDFVHGTMVGIAMLGRPEDEWFSESDMDKATTAFRFRDHNERDALWNRLREPAEVLDVPWQVQFDLQLRGTVERPLRDCMIQDTSFADLTLGGEHEIVSVVFIRCTFAQVVFRADKMVNVGFVGCSLRGCLVAGELTDANAWFDHDCTEVDGNVVIVRVLPPVPVAPVVGPAGTDFVKLVLEQFWPPGRPFARPVLQVRTLYQGVRSEDRVQVTDAIDELRVAGLLAVADRLAKLDFDKMSEVRRILGR